jgi:hypothetical protein
MSAVTFFPPGGGRPALDGFVRGAPSPLATGYARLQAELDRQEPVAAAWQLRDAFECGLKFAACVAAADYLHAQPDGREASDLARLLLKPQGLSLGDWHTALELALRPAAPGRVLPGLAGLFFTPGGKRTALNRRIDGDADSFVAWRNRVFGHGVFKQERGWYAEQTLLWLPALNEFYAALANAFAGCRLVARTADGGQVRWHGATEGPAPGPHTHEAPDEPLPLWLVPVSSPSPLAGEGRGGGEGDPTGQAPGALSLGPLLSVQRCAVCGEPAAFFFDRNRYERDKDRHRTFFLEYFRGHHGERRDWAAVRELAKRVPADFEWQRTSYDSDEVVEGVRLVFRDFETEYRRPAYLLDAVWRAADEWRKGYVHVVGPAGVGKTFLVRGLEADGRARGVPVLTYHVLPGALTDYRTFLVELHDRASESLRLRTPQVQCKGSTREELAAELAAYLAELMRANRLDTLLVALDALDELPDPEPTGAAITDFLPAAAALPDGCFVVLTSRETLRPRIAERLDQVKRASGEAFVTIPVGADAADNQQLLRGYLAERLPEAFRRPNLIEEVLRRSGGVFLYAYHFCRALDAGAFTKVEQLPEGEEFYPAYLARLRERVGEQLYETVYLPTLLLLAAAYQPVMLTQLQRWGVPGDRLRFALLDLGDFLRVHRGPHWQETLSEGPGENRYEIAHEAFVRWVREDPAYAERMRAAHRTIGRASVAAHAGHWPEADPTDDGDLYDIRYTPAHLQAGGLGPDEIPSVDRLSLFDTCVNSSTVARNARRWQLANRLAQVGRDLLAWGGTSWPREMQLYGRAFLGNALASALDGLGRLDEALACAEDGIDSLRQLLATYQGPDNPQGLLWELLASKGNLLHAAGDFAGALACREEIIAGTHQAAARGDLSALAELAHAVVCKGNALMMSADNAVNPAAARSAADRCWEEGIGLYRRLVEEHRQDSYLPSLANALSKRAMFASDSGDLAGAAGLLDEPIELLRRAARAERNPDNLTRELAVMLQKKGLTLFLAEQPQEAFTFLDEAIAILRRAMQTEDRHELVGELAQTLMYKADCLSADDQGAAAGEAADDAAAVLTEAIAAGMDQLIPLFLEAQNRVLDRDRNISRAAAARAVQKVVHIDPPIREMLIKSIDRARIDNDRAVIARCVKRCHDLAAPYAATPGLLGDSIRKAYAELLKPLDPDHKNLMVPLDQSADELDRWLQT